MFLHSKKLGTVVAALVIVSTGLWSVSRIANAASPSHQTHKTHATKAASACKKVTAKGSVRFSDWQFPSSLNGFQTNAVVAVLSSQLIFDSPWRYDNNARMSAFQLTKIPSTKNGQISKDGKTITMTLKSGLHWSNGKAVTMQDFQFGWKVDMNKLTGPFCLGSCDVIKKFDVVNSTTGKLLLQHPAPLSTVLTFGDMPSFGWPGPNGGWSKGDVAGAAKWIEDPLTNFETDQYPTDGPYQVASWSANDRITFKPMTHYSNFTCGAQLKNPIFVFYSSIAGMIAAAANKDTDMTQDYTTANLALLNQSAGPYKVASGPAFSYEHIEFNQDATAMGKPNPVSNVKVRQALSLALDHLGLISSALGVSTSYAKTIEAFTPWIITKALVQQFADTKLKGQWDPLANKGKGAYVTQGTTQALADAKKLLTSAGFGSGVTVDLVTTTGNPVRAQEQAICQQSWAKIGVTTTIRNIPASTYFGGYNAGGTLSHGDFQAAIFTFSGSPEPDGFKFVFQPQYVERNQTNKNDATQGNYTGLNDPKITKAFNVAYKSPNNKVRAANYKVVQDRLNQQVDWLTFYYRPSIATYDSNFTGFKLNPTSAGQTWNAQNWKVK
jgi:peptide/nickel transport system substrate-binding protein